MRAGDVVVDVAAAPQQLQQAALHVMSVGGFAALDQQLAALQQGVHPTRVLTHRLLEGLHVHTHACAQVSVLWRRWTRTPWTEGTHLQLFQLLAGVSSHVIYFSQTSVQVSQPERKLLPFCLKLLPL